MKSHMRATAPLWTDASNNRSVHHVWAEDSVKGNSSWHKCCLCHTSTHWPDQCLQFAAMIVDERIKTAKENHVCFGCLKRAGWEHRLENCSCKQHCPSIGDDITAVQTLKLADLLCVSNEKIHRGKVHTDMLIGIDHTHIHMGQTKQVGQVVARKTLLG